MIKKILVSQPQPASDKSPYFDIAKKHSVDITFRPFFKVERLSAREFRDQRITILDHSAIVFTSRQAIEHFFSMCKDLRVALPEELKYFAISEQISLYIQKFVQYRKRKVFWGEDGKLTGLVAMMAKHKTETYLVPTTEHPTAEMSTLLTEKKLKFTECAMFRTLQNPWPADEKFDFDLVLCFTPAGVQALTESLKENQADNVRLGTFGTATAQVAKETTLDLVIQAPQPATPSMTAALDVYLTSLK
ncbi:MAG: uroporphyrinogen-III synthase [Alloprevotella sp.]|nr:uroporphyrinogen-III synthase [Alloprevotella sp.]